MHIIKLNAIGSTNTFLKEMVKEKPVDNYTVIWADSQFQGRGQMGTVWSSEPGKNLTFSVFVKWKDFKLTGAAYLNYCIAVAIYNRLKSYKVPNLSVKWPNDILAGNAKIGGILIENSVSKERIQHTIIGFGLNVNQLKFSDDLGKVSSLQLLLAKEINREDLLTALVTDIKKQMTLCVPGNFQNIKKNYLSVLYKYRVPAMFSTVEGVQFMGKIVDVSESGSLQIELEDRTVQAFGLKEVKFVYN